MLSRCVDELRAIDAARSAEEREGEGAASAAPLRTPPASTAVARTEAVNLRIISCSFSEVSMRLQFYAAHRQRRDKRE